MSAFASTVLAYAVIALLLWGYALKLAIEALAMRGNARLGGAGSQNRE